MSARPPRPRDAGAGERIGKYAVIERLGRGSMGEVYLARDPGLDRLVAVKILAEAHRNHTELRARFEREARAMAMISSPHVVSVFAIDEHEGLPYFAMEYLPGLDLATLLARSGPIPPAEAAQVALYAVRGLRAAAAKGLVHRDIKPANIIVTENGSVKVTDFGLAKQIHVDPELTAAGVVVGTPDYIAPEQAQGNPMDARADIYSLGCTLFHLVAGSPPFRTESGPNTYMTIIDRHLHQPRPRLADLRADVDLDLSDLCAEMMSVSPEQRPDFEILEARLAAIVSRLQGGLPRVRRAPNTASQPTVSERGRPPESALATRPPRDPLQSTWISRGVAGIPGWAIIVTILSAALFLVGLGLRLTGG